MPGSHPGTVITWWTISPALLILIFPLGFRLTCYYYRKAYYRGFWQVATGLRGVRRPRLATPARPGSR